MLRRSLTLGLLLAAASAAAQTPYLVKDFTPGGSTSSRPDSLIGLGSTLLFTSPSGDLWKTDGTAAGTVLVKSLPLTVGATNSPVVSGGSVFFQGCTATNGCELWKTDGTSAGTVLVKDIRPGSSSSSPIQLTDVNGTLFFAANDGATGLELWKSDGTAAGTALVRDIYAGTNAGISSVTTDLPQSVNGLLLFQGCDAATGCELWRSDGTTAGTFRLTDIYPGTNWGYSVAYPTVVGNVLFFSGYDPNTTGGALWKSDGSLGGTSLVIDLTPSVADGGPGPMANVNGTLYFGAYAGVNSGLWKSNGTPGGTTFVSNVFPYKQILGIGPTAYFWAIESGGAELWKSNGTGASTVIVRDINPGSSSSYDGGYSTLLDMNGTLVFVASDGANGTELWKSNGTAAGTVMLKDIYPGTGSFGPNSSNPRSFARANDRLFFVATDAANGSEIWGMRPQGTWQPFFAVDTRETPYVGDFNGDGKTDIITFARDNPSAFGDVYASLSSGTAFGSNTKWHDFFAISPSEQVIVGDYDGDGNADIGTWLGTTSKQVYVARSFGTGMGQADVWLSSIGSSASDIVVAGDANGDGKKDIICFARTEGKVYVALSNGTSFGTPTVWHNFFAVSTYERPAVADLNGDGKVDIVTFATDSPTAFGDVYTALSTGTQFGDKQNSNKWHDFFAIRPTEIVRIGDLNGDLKQDFYTFLPPPFGQCYTALSQGTAMADNVLWREEVTPLGHDVPFVGDANGDGKADLIVFAQDEGKVYVSLAP
jgi:ELWxxDGT repeat protein